MKTSDFRPFIIPIFLPNLGCPHRCVFCNQAVVTGAKQNIPSPEKLQFQINKFLDYKGKRRNRVQISFYGGNFLGLKKNYIKSLLYEATKFVNEGKVESIRFSTRPDTIDNDRLDILKDFPVKTIELGVQSMDNHVLTMAKRGHTSSDTEKAVNLLKKRNYEIGLQMMIGLPGDNEIKALATGRRIADLSPDFVRIYPAIVFEKTILASWYKKGSYTPLSLETCVSLVKKLYLYFRKNSIQVIRMGLQASEHLEKNSTILAGPHHPAFGHLVYSEIFLDMAASILESKRRESKKRESKKDSCDKVVIKVHPQSISRMRGLKNKNIEILKTRFHIKSLKIISDFSIKKDEIQLHF